MAFLIAFRLGYSKLKPRIHPAADKIGAEEEIAVPDTPPAIAAVLLAAGLSTRAGPRNKLLVPAPGDPAGRPMVRACAEALLSGSARPVVVVTGHQAAEIGQALEGLDVGVTRNADFADGVAGSLAAGIAAVPDAAAGAVVALGDMPNLDPATIGALIAAFDPGAGRTICVPVRAGRRGNPVLFGRTHFADLGALAGDRGGKAVVRANSSAVIEVPVDDGGIHQDFDAP